MYFIYKDTDSRYKIFKSSKLTYEDLKKKGYKLFGQFGREDYCIHWVRYYNGEITKAEHRKFLGL